VSIENFAQGQRHSDPAGVENKAGTAICMAGEQGGALHRGSDLLHRLFHSGADH
jgi:hypothetical protein